MKASLTADSNMTKSTKEAMSEMVKQAILNKIIKKHLHFEGRTDDKWWLQSSVKEYSGSGNVSGSFLQAIQLIALDYEGEINSNKE